MANGSCAEAPVSVAQARGMIRGWCRFASLVFGGMPENESVATRVYCEAAPEVVWRQIQFYEEVPGKPPLLLSLFLCPLGTDGDKSKVGARILCRYKHGNLVKRITAFEMPNMIRFKVTEQHLGIEDCVVARNGSYQVRRFGAGSEIVLTTHYLAYLYPRWLWRPMERLALHQLHSHILNGMRKAIAVDAETTGMPVMECVCGGDKV